MFNICSYNAKRRMLRLAWFVAPDARQEVRSRWSMQDSPDIVADVCGSREGRNQPVTNSWETEPIAACAGNQPGVGR